MRFHSFVGLCCGSGQCSFCGSGRRSSCFHAPTAGATAPLLARARLPTPRRSLLALPPAQRHEQVARHMTMRPTVAGSRECKWRPSACCPAPAQPDLGSEAGLLPQINFDPGSRGSAWRRHCCLPPRVSHNNDGTQARDGGPEGAIASGAGALRVLAVVTSLSLRCIKPKVIAKGTSVLLQGVVVNKHVD
ncbi:hypothetical protein ACP4OV_008689 [Aristida adscensionis]